jgi:hypothetical protein
LRSRSTASSWRLKHARTSSVNSPAAFCSCSVGVRVQVGAWHVPLLHCGQKVAVVRGGALLLGYAVGVDTVHCAAGASGGRGTGR